ncbi:MAG: hypothetical protein J7K89_04880 [Candidatus Cloacimonetes bacterium]|nr:hypothetical protein [Candidatus Cloacimonadota bacterium]
MGWNLLTKMQSGMGYAKVILIPLKNAKRAISTNPNTKDTRTEEHP